MQKLMFAVLAGMILSATTLAGQFQLRDDRSGNLQGPFEFRDGAKVTIGGQTYTLVRVDGIQPDHKARMNGIVIPEIDFRQAALVDVVQFLSEASVKHARDDEGQPAAGINFILSGVTPDEGAQPSITFSARQITLLDAINTIAKLGNLNLRSAGANVLILQQPRDP